MDVSTLPWVRLFANINAASTLRCIRLVGALLLSAALVACGQSADTQDTAQPAVVVSPNDDRAYDLIELANGLEVMLVSDPTAEKSAAALSIGLGAASDPDDYPGMAHYLEHMLFMGSAQFPDPDGFMAFTAEHGGMTNAYTGLDITNWATTLPTDSRLAISSRWLIKPRGGSTRPPWRFLSSTTALT